MAGSAAKDRVFYPLQKWVVNPIVMLAHNPLTVRVDLDPR
jgi:hypothetical protein